MRGRWRTYSGCNSRTRNEERGTRRGTRNEDAAAETLPQLPRSSFGSHSLGLLTVAYASAGAFGFTRTLFAGMPTFTWKARTSFVATAMAPTIAFWATRTPANTVA